MPHILTIVSPRDLTTPQIAAFTKLGGHSVYELGPDAADIRFAEAPVWDEVNELATEHGFDFAIHDEADVREKKFLQADMDSTIIEQECLDELADLAGVGAEVAAVTERAMRGAEEALRGNDLAEAIDRQSDAMEALREGLRNMGEAMAEDQRQRSGQQGQAQGETGGERNDPLGRQAGNLRQPV